MRRLAPALAVLVALTLVRFAQPAPARAELPPLIPREAFFGDPDQNGPQISPDGRLIVWVKRGEDGVMNLWLRSLERDSSWQLTREARGVRFCAWTPDGRHLLTLNDTGGDENQHVFAIDPATGAVRDLTPFAGVRVEGLRADRDHPGEMLVGLNRRDPKVFDLHRLNLETGAITLDTENPGDVLDWTTDRARVQAVAFEYQKPEWRVLDPSIKPDMDALAKAADGGMFYPTGADAAGRKWTVRIVSDRNPGRFILWDRDTRRATPLFDTRPDLAKLTLAAMQPVSFKAADGLTITGYLTLPPGVEAKNLPLVLNIHGGPWARDSWGYNPEVQWLANRGYAVLQVNFRASTGFGTVFLNAGDREFGRGKVQGDISAAAKWAVAQGVADPKRVGILGWSFGGYATLCGLAFTPDLFACGVDGVGPSDLGYLISSFPPYWATRRQRWLNRFGDVVADSVLNQRLSPLYHVDKIRAPLLIGHGANDPRVKLAASERIVEALRGRGRPVEFVVYPNEGHGFARSENRQDFYGRVEQFLARHLGGRAEPWRDVQGTTAVVR